MMRAPDVPPDWGVSLLEEAAHPDEETFCRASEAPRALPAVSAHARECDPCASDLALLEESLSQLTPDLWAEARALPGQPPGLGDRLRGWLESLASELTASLEPLRPPRRAAVFAFKTETRTPRQELRFGDERISGLLLAEKDRVRLHLEHTEWPAGSMALLAAESPNGNLTWTRFVVFRPGWKSRVAEAVADAEALDGCRLWLREVGPDLPPAAAEMLLRSYEAAAADDPASVPFWRSAAAACRAAAPPVPELERVLLTILDDGAE